MSELPAGLAVLPVAGLPEFSPGDDLAGAIAAAAPWLADGDVVVVTSKVVSKVEGRLVRVPPGADREALRLRAVEDEAVRVVARRGSLAIVQTRQGWVVAAAGIDASNVGRDALVLLPEDGDASARRLRARLRDLLGVDVAVVVSDTFGRTWREGLTDVAVGSAGSSASHPASTFDASTPAFAQTNPCAVSAMTRSSRRATTRAVSASIVAARSPSATRRPSAFDTILDVTTTTSPSRTSADASVGASTATRSSPGRTSGSPSTANTSTPGAGRPVT